MLFLAKRRHGSAWEDPAPLPKRRAPVRDAAPWSLWNYGWGWPGAWDWPGWDWPGWEAAEAAEKPKKIRKNTVKDNESTETGKTSRNSSQPVAQSALPTPAIPAGTTLPPTQRFSPVVNAVEPKSGNLLIDCAAITQVFGRPPLIRPSENRMNARVGSMVVFGLQPGDIPVATDIVINGFDSDIGLRDDPVRDDNCGEVAGLLPGQRPVYGTWKGKKGGEKSFGKDKGKECKGKDGKGKNDMPSLTGKAYAKGSFNDSLWGPKGRGKASARGSNDSIVHPWST